MLDPLVKLRDRQKRKIESVISQQASITQADFWRGNFDC